MNALDIVSATTEQALVTHPDPGRPASARHDKSLARLTRTRRRRGAAPALTGAARC